MKSFNRNIKAVVVTTLLNIMKQLGVSRVTAIKMLNRLVEEGFLYHEGTTKTSKYFIKK